MSKTLCLILGNQLFDFKYYSKLSDDVFMCEDKALCTHFKYHKHKIIFFLSSMRFFADYIKSKGKSLSYYEIDQNKDFIEELKEKLKKYDALECYEIEDSFFREKIVALCKKMSIELIEHQSPMFLTSKDDFKVYLEGVKKPFMNSFYIQTRKKHKILIESDGNPVGGKWSFDDKNRKKIPKKFDVIKNDLPPYQDKYTKAVIKSVDKFFKSHPGKSSNYWIPNNRKDAISWYKIFLKDKFDKYGDYQDAIDERDPFLYHSLISPFMNIGFLTPKEVIKEAIKYKDKVPLNSLEGFVRQVIGWREFVRGIYHNYEEQMDSTNFWKHKKKLTDHWYTGDTGIPPVDYVIKKTIEYGYAHHIERLMIIGNIMLLLEFHPKEVYKWFMEMYVDSSDWVMAANVYAMTQFSEGGIFATKPYICGSNYLIKMSHYKKDEWCDGVDGLYWSFIEKNKDFFSKNPRLSMMVRILEKMDSDRKKLIYKEANKLRKKLTS